MNANEVFEMLYGYERIRCEGNGEAYFITDINQNENTITLHNRGIRQRFDLAVMTLQIQNGQWRVLKG